MGDDEPDIWHQPEEWDDWSKKRRAIEEATPEFQTRRRNIRTLSNVVGDMLYPPGPFLSTSELWGGQIHHMLPPSIPMRKGEYPTYADHHLSRALERYCGIYRNAQYYDSEIENLSRLPVHLKNLVLESCEIAKWPFKLGAALYLHQQIAVRKKDQEPSQGKAQWLVAKAPVKPIERGGRIPLRPDGGEPSKIGDQWKKYFAVAHYWAAFVVWAKSPLDYPTDRFALIDFVSTADPDEFLSNAAAFKKFRAEQPMTRTKILPLIKQGIDRSDGILDDVVPTPPLSIPDLLAPYQWASLAEYKTRPRANRKANS